MLAGLAIGSVFPVGSEAQAGFGFLIGGLLTFALRWYLNVLRPKGRVESYITSWRSELESAMASRTFQPSPGVAMPADPEFARSQMQQILGSEEALASKGLRNRSSLFFIPIQWLGVVAAVLSPLFFIRLGASKGRCQRFA